MSNRYKIISKWVTVEQLELEPYYHDDERGGITIIREAADTKDIVGGYEYSYGVYRVRSFYNSTGRSYSRAKRFYGEVAQHSSERLFDDLTYQFNRQAKEAN